MAARRSGWINWDALGDEAEEDASELNYDYEWLVSDQGICTWIHSFSQSMNAFVFLIWGVDSVLVFLQMEMSRRHLIGAAVADSDWPEVSLLGKHVTDTAMSLMPAKDSAAPCSIVAMVLRTRCAPLSTAPWWAIMVRAAATA